LHRLSIDGATVAVAPDFLDAARAHGFLDPASVFARPGGREIHRDAHRIVTSHELRFPAPVRRLWLVRSSRRGALPEVLAPLRTMWAVSGGRRPSARLLELPADARRLDEVLEAGAGDPDRVEAAAVEAAALIEAAAVIEAAARDLGTAWAGGRAPCLLPWLVLDCGEEVTGSRFRSVLPASGPFEHECFRAVCALGSRGVAHEAVERFASVLRTAAGAGGRTAAAALSGRESEAGARLENGSPALPRRVALALRRGVVEADRSGLREVVDRDGLFVVDRAAEEPLRQAGVGSLREGVAFEGGTLQRRLADRTNRRFRTAGFRRTPVRWFYKAYPRVARWSPAAGAAAREWRNARLLRTLGIRTAALGAFGECRASGIARVWARGPSFVVTREVDGGRPLDDWMREPDASGEPRWTSLAPVARRRAVREVARLAATMHGAGAFHKDFYACHLLVRPSGRGDAFALDGALIDLERMRFRARPRRRWFVKDLAALGHSAPEVVTRAERARFLREYLHERGIRPRASVRRAWARRVRRKAERIAAHRPKR